MIFIIIISVMWLFLFFFSITRGNAIDYNTAYDEDYVDAQGPLYKLFRIGFKLMVPISVILYAQARFKSKFNQISYSSSSLITFIAVAFIGLFLFLANKLGSRSDIVALTLGVLILEFKLGLNLKKILTIGALGFGLVLFLLYIEQTRTESSIEDLSFAHKFLLKDYYAPAHILYAAMAYDYVKPFEVIQSNISNSLIMLNYPYLQAPVTDLFNPGVATRSAGYAFYLFTEGYIFMGNLGFLYNGFMLMVGLSVWYLIQNSSNKYYNYIIVAIMCTQLANLARNQSSYIYKDIYIFFIPILVILYFSSGLRPKFKLLK
ncbi:hypothetical protein [Arcticibacter svalbardensis]|nr:hypothetical protein [Arcticibacter svalbardensis]